MSDSDLNCHHQGVIRVINSKHYATCNEKKKCIFDSMIENNNIPVVQACPLLPELQGYQLDPFKIRQICVNVCTVGI